MCEAAIKISHVPEQHGGECRDERQPLLEQLAVLTGKHQSELDGCLQVTTYELREDEALVAHDTFTEITPIFKQSLLVKNEK